ncbi:tetratricopeptide repeat protein [Niallia sp. 03133]|uniref:tetratricopeptide repeat protein n=1 Tax=Niallia sp. 03133 TaxID=3458060 RepID=UPI00404463BB
MTRPDKADNEWTEVKELMDSALLEMKNKDMKTAIQLWEKVIHLDGNNADAHAWLAACYGASIDDTNLLNKMVLNAKMKKELDNAFYISPNSPVAHKVLGIRYLNAPPKFGGDVNKAIECLLNSIKFDNKDADVHYYLGTAYLKNNETDKAINSFQTCIEKDESHEEAKQKLAQLQL